MKRLESIPECTYHREVHLQIKNTCTKVDFNGRIPFSFLYFEKYDFFFFVLS